MRVKVLHSRTIPEGSICVKITQTSASCIPMPLVLGDHEENSFLAIPKRNLFNDVNNIFTQYNGT